MGHSYLNASTGFFDAARQLCQMIAAKAIAQAMTGPAIKAQYGIGVLKLNLDRKTFPRINATGNDIIDAIIIHFE